MLSDAVSEDGTVSPLKQILQTRWFGSNIELFSSTIDGSGEDNSISSTWDKYLWCVKTRYEGWEVDAPSATSLNAKFVDILRSALLTYYYDSNISSKV